MDARRNRGGQSLGSVKQVIDRFFKYLWRRAPEILIIAGAVATIYLMGTV